MFVLRTLHPHRQDRNPPHPSGWNNRAYGQNSAPPAVSPGRAGLLWFDHHSPAVLPAYLSDASRCSAADPTNSLYDVGNIDSRPDVLKIRALAFRRGLSLPRLCSSAEPNETVRWIHASLLCPLPQRPLIAGSHACGASQGPDDGEPHQSSTGILVPIEAFVKPFGDCYSECDQP
jgi:hypothetical protein